MIRKPGPDMPFQARLTFSSPTIQRCYDLVQPIVDGLIGFPQTNAIYRAASDLSRPAEMSQRTLDVMDVTWNLPAGDLDRIPRKGPLIVVANHPFGGVEGMLLDALLKSVRPDVKLMMNFLLRSVVEYQSTHIFVDPFGGPDAVRRSLSGTKQAIQWVNDGGVLGVFPSGEVSSYDREQRGIVDPPWQRSVARIVRKTGAPVLPIYFDGDNGWLFAMLKYIHPLLRTALLPRMLLNKRHKAIPVRIGTVIPASKLASYEDDHRLMEYLRMRTYIQANRVGPSSKTRVMVPAGKDDIEPTATPQDPQLMADEYDRLPKEQILAQTGPLQVAYARAHQIPCLMHEIGRLREVTFREVGEGTGMAIDLDEFDQHYIHLILWHTKKHELVGAYRLGLTDEILARQGKRGLYTTTLFGIKTKVLKQISPAIELGRSWIRVEYQKSYSPLLLLWKGIGGFVSAHPQYKMLFGPVSISNEYQSFSRYLLMEFLRLNKFLPGIARGVKPKNPPRRASKQEFNPRLTSTVVHDMEEVESLVREIESDDKGMPILLRQYLRMNAKLMGFNVDPLFGDVLDGLMLVDLTSTDERVLAKYMGKDACRQFMAYHENNVDHRTAVTR